MIQGEFLRLIDTKAEEIVASRLGSGELPLVGVSWGISDNHEFNFGLIRSMGNKTLHTFVADMDPENDFCGVNELRNDSFDSSKWLAKKSIVGAVALETFAKLNARTSLVTAREVYKVQLAEKKKELAGLFSDDLPIEDLLATSPFYGLTPNHVSLDWWSRLEPVGPAYLGGNEINLMQTREVENTTAYEQIQT